MPSTASWWPLSGTTWFQLFALGSTRQKEKTARHERSFAVRSVVRSDQIDPVKLSPMVVAYEPIWAIGTGKTASPSMAAEAHFIIRSEVARLVGRPIAEALRILYGGSVKPDNATALLSQPEIDGALVGGASLDPHSFATHCEGRSGRLALAVSEASGAGSCSSPQTLNENIFPFDSYGVNCNSFLRVLRGSCRGIEGPGVPGTNQLAVFDHPFGQRTTAVGAFVVQGPDYPVDVGNAERPGACTELLGLSRSRQLAPNAYLH